MYKYRSMCIGAEKKLKEYLEQNDEARKEFEENQKLRRKKRSKREGVNLCTVDARFEIKYIMLQ